MTNKHLGRLCAAIAVLVAASATAADKNATAPKTFVRADGVTVNTDVQYLGRVEPAVAFVDARTLPVVPEWRPGDPLVEIPRQHWGEAPGVVPKPVNATSPYDPLLAQQFATQIRGGSGFTTPLVNVLGDASQASPPDSTGDIGTNHFVEAVNGSGGTTVRIFNKADGTLAAGPFQLNSAGFTGGGVGACTSALGDPIVIFDDIANRWVITEFSSQAGRSFCVYVSATDNPVTTTWFRYAFQAPAFPDYPKYGVWPNAYFIGANESSTAGARALFALERDKMLTGQPARFVRTTVPNLSGFGFQMTTPADFDGRTLPAANAPGIFMRHRDDEVHAPGANNPNEDQLQIFEFTVNWPSVPTDPATGSVAGPVNVPTAEFSSDLNGLSAFNAFPQPTLAGAPGGQKIDPLREPIMNKLNYRNFGSYESLVGNFISDIDGNDTGGIRWFELRRTGGAPNPWTMYQQGTWAGPGATQDGADRWMGGIAMDESGNIALGYSTVRDTAPPIWPSLRYVGRQVGDPLGVMTTGEANLVTGLGTHGNERWGDYFQMGVDPVDGCTFWFVGEYMPTSGSSQKGTRIGSFRFNACGSPTFVASGDNLNQQVCTASGAQSLTPVNISTSAFNGFSGSVALSLAAPVPTGFSGVFTPPAISPPASSSLQLTAAVTAAAGPNVIGVNAVSGAITRSFNVNVFVASATAATPALTTPANGAINVSTTGTFTWGAAAQAQSYVIEIATDAAFTSIVRTLNATGTSAQVTPALNSNTTYFWRVRASNICGASTNSPVFSFTTQAAPGDCGVGSNPAVAFQENVESGTNGWTTPAGQGALWAISNARPFGGTGNSWLAQDYPTTSDQYLVSPTVVLPTGQTPLTLQFQQDRTLEPRTGGGCWDGGFVEYSTDGGTNWTQFTPAQVLLENYTGALNGGPANGRQAWCDTKPYTKTVLALDSLAGQSVKFRFRVSTDGSVGNTPNGWYIDDIKVQGCTTGPVDLMFRNDFE